ncbi:hypothetical protein ACP4OV_029459 [Aristida adscensionis]
MPARRLQPVARKETKLQRTSLLPPLLEKHTKSQPEPDTFNR